MSQVDFQTLINKVMSDGEFAKTLAADPAKALKTMGVDATPEMVDALKGVDAAALKNLAASFGDDRAAL
jgi:hypothetical protein